MEESVWFVEVRDDSIKDGQDKRRSAIVVGRHETDVRDSLHNYVVKDVVKIDLTDPKWAGLVVVGFKVGN